MIYWKNVNRNYVGETMISETEEIVNIIRKMKYKVGQKFMVEMREGYHLSKVVRRVIEICRIDECTGLIWIKFPLTYGGYRKMFGYEKDLDSMIVD